MKICPNCNKTYSDETLNFCLEDGTVLTQTNISNNETPETVFMPTPKQTEINQPFGTTPQAANNAPRYQSDTAGGSKSWVWVLVILLGLVLLCGGGGIVGLIAIGSMDDSDEPPAEITDSDTSKTDKPNEPDSIESGKLIESTDFSKIEVKSNEYISGKNDGDGLELTSRKNYYYVFAFDSFPTQDSSIKLSLKNKTGESTSMGYGLVVQGHPKNILSKDYAFVIKSDEGKYRIVKHKSLKESVVEDWTNSSAINQGTASNDLEVKISDDEMKFYINGKFVKSVKDETGYKGGVAGIYTSDDVPIIFTKLELRK